MVNTRARRHWVGAEAGTALGMGYEATRTPVRRSNHRGKAKICSRLLCRKASFIAPVCCLIIVVLLLYFAFSPHLSP